MQKQIQTLEHTDIASPVYDQQRIMGAAELIKHGAAVDDIGRLSVADSAEAYDHAHTEMENDMTKTFLHQTDEGRAILGTQRDLKKLGSSARFHFANDTLIHDPSKGDPEWVFSKEQTIRYAEDLGFSEELSRIAESSARHKVPSNEFNDLHDKIRANVDNLQLAAGIMAANPNLRAGKKISVERSPKDGKPAQIEAGWQISTIRPDGRIKVHKVDEDSRSLEKSLDAASLDKWNPATSESFERPA